MKLPGIKYSRPVQPLGKQNLDIAAPVRVANARASAVGKLTTAFSDIAEANEELDLAGAQSRIIQKMAMVEADAKSKGYYTTQELEEMGIEYKAETEVIDPETKTLVAVERERIPASEVGVDVFNNQAEAVLQSEIGELRSVTAQNKLKLFYSRIYSQGAQKAIERRNEVAVAEMAAKASQQFSDAVNSGNLVGATNVAEAALKTGIWSPEKYEQNTTDLPSKVRSSQYMIASQSTNRIAELDRLKTEALFDDSLTPSDRKAVVKDINSITTAIEKDQEADRKMQREQQSHDAFMMASTGILERREAMEWGEVLTMTLGMETADAKALINLNRSIQDTVNTKSDPEVKNRLSVMIQSLSIPSETNTLSQRRAHMVQELNRAMGYDPVSGDREGVTSLSAEDYRSLYGAINTASEFEIDNPDVQVVSDHIWTTLTGAPKTGLGTFLDQPGPHSVIASQAEYDLMRAAQGIGPGFNPHEWWTENKEKYMTRQVRRNIDSANKLRDGSRVADHIVTNPDGNPDKDATLKDLESKIRNNQISDEDAASIADSVMGAGQ